MSTEASKARTTAPTGLLIGGVWGPSRSGATFDVVDPATEQVVATVSSATAEEVAEAVEQAQHGELEHAGPPPGTVGVSR